MTPLFPPKLQAGDLVRVVAPARSLKLISPETRQLADQRFAELGLRLSFGDHVEEADEFMSSSVESRVADLHAAFADPEVKMISTVIGGFNSNQLLRHLDWDLIRANPKVVCGYSDITILNNAMLAKTGLVTYSGPHYSTFGQKHYLDYTLAYFKKCLFSDEPFTIEPSTEWTDDRWFLDQEDRHPQPSTGFLLIQAGEAEGTVVGSNLGTLNLLMGTEYMPPLAGSILFAEDTALHSPEYFDRELQAVLHQPGGDKLAGVVIGRFQVGSQMKPELLRQIVASKPELKGKPVIAEVDFGHTDPRITFPVGGRVRLSAQLHGITLDSTNH